MTLSKLAILGPGLLGGSIALAFRERVARSHIAVWARREAAVQEVRARGLAEVVSTELQAVVAEAEFIVLCVPVGVMAELAAQLVPFVDDRVIVTDVGSVKAPVVGELGRIFRGRARFVGSHPMAGSELAGLDAASASLFEGAVSIVTPDERTDPGAVETVTTFWESLGCRVRMLPPDEHDQVVSLVSHLPHLLAATLVNSVAAQNTHAFDFCGPGFRDTTRVASGPPGMWAEIFSSNRAAVRKSAEAMIEKLREAVALLDDPNRMRAFLTEAKTQRDRLKPRN